MEPVNAALAFCSSAIMLSEKGLWITDRPFSVQFLLLLFVCIQRASFMHMLHLFLSFSGDFQAQPIGWNMNYSALSRFQ